ncbi:MAG TPA: hypothetical protein PLZ93_03455 [Nocardioides sp.]|uniref:hypothetical protein n=1 Tax=uncultured Nocardioides sp. TaxID=198441 RepID=UPI0026209550|nr:hypothetical protein [uncultured Nocardioides sp.]HRD60104.1 hypothetical protein [Nocardioides sp.]HRI94648.1 hypothetical protein [Nocardioides sp.]HRK45303.1 hypothetical protein [Nocardioides sp.]
MSDLIAFRANRSLRRATPHDDSVLITEWSETDPAIHTHVVRWEWGGDELIPALRELGSGDGAPSAAQTLAAAYLASPTAVTLAALHRPVDPAAVLPEPDADGNAVPVPGQVGLAFLDRLDRWLVVKDNRPGPDEFDAWLEVAWARLAADLGATLDADDPPSLERRSTLFGLLGRTWARLLDSLAAALLSPAEGELAARLTRLMLVAGLVERRSLYARSLTVEEILALLSRRTLLLPDPPFPDVVPPNRVKLVRQATTSDLFVVRREWRGYVADEVADIRNVLAKESSLTRFVRIDESELVQTDSQRQDSTTENSSEVSDESSFEEQSKRELSLDLSAHAQVDVSAQYSSVSIAASAGFDADFSLEDSTERATQVAKKAIARAASKTETQVREDRTRRTLTRTELRQRHQLDNDTSEHVRGVYRWVKRVDRFQVWRYPDRFQLEFQLPEPGRYLLSQLQDRPAKPGAVSEPPEFELPDGITVDNYLDLASTYHATGLPEPPQATLGASAAITLVPDKSSGSTGGGGGDKWNPPVLTKETELPITPGYAVTSVEVGVEATPLMDRWVYESPKIQWLPLESYHTITATVAVGDQVTFDAAVGTDGGNKTTIQATGTSTAMMQYLDAHLHAASGDLQLDPPVTAKLPIGVSLVGALSGTVAVRATCTLTAQAEDAWRQEVYDALRAGYDAWVREWRAQQAMAAAPSALAERSPARNAELIRAELRRHVISWLLGESPFRGRNAVGAEEPDIEVDEAIDTAAAIQFLEQSLEWSNLSYVCYPYYWADRDRWPDLMDLETADPALGDFLRAGSVRVVVPARLGFTCAVTHWLTWRQPWLGGALAPLPGDDLYVSVAREIQDQLVPPADGVPGESWEVALPTTLQWLDESVLPRNELGRLGEAPHEPADPLLPDPA